MPFSSGTFSLTATSVAPAVANTTIDSSDFNTSMADIVSGLNSTLLKDGSNTPSANLPMATYKHTNVGNASARTQYSAAGQIQDGGLIFDATETGTGDAYEIALSPAITAYVSGMRLSFIASELNTGASTLNVNSVGAVAIKKLNGADTVTGDILANQIVDVEYNGTNWILLSPAEPTAGTVMAGKVVTADASGVISNATLASPVLNTGVSGTAVDTDTTLAADSDTKLASQRATKAYVDTRLSGATTITGINFGNETLNAYDIGTWTPTIQDTSFSDAEGQTYSSQTGYYVRIGNVVLFSCTVVITSLGTLTTTDNAYIAGLPGSITATGNRNGTISVGSASSLNITAGQAVTGFLAGGGGSPLIQLKLWDAATGNTSMLISEVSAGATLILTGMYFVD